MRGAYRASSPARLDALILAESCVGKSNDPWTADLALNVMRWAYLKARDLAKFYATVKPLWMMVVTMTIIDPKMIWRVEWAPLEAFQPVLPNLLRETTRKRRPSKFERRLTMRRARKSALLPSIKGFGARNSALGDRADL